MKWFRSEEMEYISLIVNEDAAHDCVQKLGDLGVMEFTDMNPEVTPFQRRYVSYVKRCDEMERKIRYFEGELAKFGIVPKSAGSIDEFLNGAADIRYGSQDTAVRALDTLERILEDKEQELLQLNTMHEKLTGEYNERKELQEIMARAGEFFEVDMPEIGEASSVRSAGGNGGFPSPGAAKALMAHAGDGDQAIHFRSITGVVPAVERLKFERMVFRSTRGNCLSRFSAIEEPMVDPATAAPVETYAFVIFFQSTFIETKLRKICDAFHARLYTLPPMDDRAAISKIMQNNNVELNQAGHILRRNRESCILLCKDIAETLESWKWSVLQEKATYHTLNMFRVDVAGMLRGEGWVIKSAAETVRTEVARAHEAYDKVMPSLVDQVAEPWPEAPTFFETNKYTEAFQEFVETYGCARYREVNPGIFTTVMLPFLFGIMYGDIGHGFIVLLFSLYLIKTEKKLENGEVPDMFQTIYYGRYIIFMMGLFSMYSGFLYNDFFALPLNLFGSRFDYPECRDNIYSSNETIRDTKCEAMFKLHGESKLTQIFAADVSDGANVYPFGLDPMWMSAENELLFVNSFKMKLSVIVGISQMIFGICMKGANNLHYKDLTSFFFEFIPQLVFACAFFLYMIILIVIKWSIDWTSRMKFEKCPYDLLNDGKHTGCRPPSLINTLINIVLSPGKLEDPLYKHQLTVQHILLLLALISIPWMLLIKPFILKAMHNKKVASEVQTAVQVDEEQAAAEEEEREEEEARNHGATHSDFDFGEIFIGQAIETIEFVLGMVSNTASYLRLWALSLAHTELATVFWEKAMRSMINMNSPIAIFFGFAVYAAVTFGVILAMDVLECYLHALRLQWVEFQNKFFMADGHKFYPLSFKQIIYDARTAAQ